MLTPHSEPLTRRQARHLLCRAAYSANPGVVDSLTGRIASDVIREWMAQPRDSWFLLNPAWMSTLYPPSGATADEVRAYLDANNYYIQEVRVAWMRELLTGGLRSRMTLFWHNHFVTDFRKYRYAPLAVRYVRLLQSAAFGKLPHLAKQMGREGAMLYYLDGRYSTRAAPNENYARELLELFTMGPTDEDGNPNYTQTDITEAARAMTGHRMNVRETYSSYFQSSLHDRNEKEIFGRVGNFDDADVVDLIFEERAERVARFIARKLARELVGVTPERSVVDGLAERFVASEFDIGELLVELLGSTYFFEERVMGIRVKEPVEMLALQTTLGGSTPEIPVARGALLTADGLGQTLLSPPNVAGWPGDHAWLNTDLLPRRWAASDWMSGFSLSAEQWRQLVSEWTSASSYPAVDFPIRLAESLLAAPLEHVSIPELDEPFAGDLTLSPLPDGFLNGPPHHINLVKLFLTGSPWYEWNPMSNVGVTRIVSFVRELARLPEYQLS